MTKKEKVLEALKDLSTEDMIWVHNNYCNELDYYDDLIECVDDLNDLLWGMKPIEIIEKFCDCSDFSTRDNYFTFDGLLGFPVSFNYYYDAPTTYYDEIADFCVEEDNDLDCDVIRTVLSEEED